MLKNIKKENKALIEKKVNKLHKIVASRIRLNNLTFGKKGYKSSSIKAANKIDDYFDLKDRVLSLTTLKNKNNIEDNSNDYKEIISKQLQDETVFKKSPNQIANQLVPISTPFKLLLFLPLILIIIFYAYQQNLFNDLLDSFQTKITKTALLKDEIKKIKELITKEQTSEETKTLGKEFIREFKNSKNVKSALEVVKNKLKKLEQKQKPPSTPKPEKNDKENGKANSSSGNSKSQSKSQAKASNSNSQSGQKGNKKNSEGRENNAKGAKVNKNSKGDPKSKLGDSLNKIKKELKRQRENNPQKGNQQNKNKGEEQRQPKAEENKNQNSNEKKLENNKKGRNNPENSNKKLKSPENRDMKSEKGKGKGNNKDKRSTKNKARKNKDDSSINPSNSSTEKSSSTKRELRNQDSNFNSKKFENLPKSKINLEPEGTDPTKEFFTDEIEISQTDEQTKPVTSVSDIRLSKPSHSKYKDKVMIPRVYLQQIK